MLFCLLAPSVVFSLSQIQISFAHLIMSQNAAHRPSGSAASKSSLLSQLKLDQVLLSIDLQSDPAKMSLDLTHIHLPEPYHKLRFLKLTCNHFVLTQSSIECLQGQLNFSGLFSSSDVSQAQLRFSYNWSEASLTLNLERLIVDKGRLSFHLQLSPDTWQAELNAKQIQIAQLKPFLQYYLGKNKTTVQQLLDNTQAIIDVQAELTGISASPENNNTAGLKQAHLTAQLSAIEYQLADNMAENLAFDLSMELTGPAMQKKSVQPAHQYRLSLLLSHMSGEILQNDIYLAFTGLEKISAHINYDSASQSMDLLPVELSIDNIAHFSTTALLNLKQAILPVNMKTQVDFINLERFNELYLTNILSDTDYEGLKLKGKANISISKNKHALTISSHFNHLSAHLNKQFIINDLSGQIHWNNNDPQQGLVSASHLSWQQLVLNKLPLGQVQLDFSCQQNKLTLLHEVDIPVFDGALHLNSLSMTQFLPEKLSLNKEAGTIHTDGFTLMVDGFIKPVSLDLVASYFNWPALDGSLSAVIPATTYNENYLTVGGAMMLKVFDGIIIIKDLKINDPLKDYAQLQANIDLNNLDLKSLTRTYNFGEIQGRVEGKLTELQLSAWQPVAFDAYIRTPANDKSTHKISQRAIDNLSSLGGASGLLSRSFLRFFETFSYSKIGLSCVLKNSICQMAGVEEKGDSYYIVKGGGIPRIDVMGYQKQVNWQVLINRLMAIQRANEAVIE